MTRYRQRMADAKSQSNNEAAIQALKQAILAAPPLNAAQLDLRNEENDEGAMD